MSRGRVLMWEPSADRLVERGGIDPALWWRQGQSRAKKRRRRRAGAPMMTSERANGTRTQRAHLRFSARARTRAPPFARLVSSCTSQWVGRCMCRWRLPSVWPPWRRVCRGLPAGQWTAAFTKRSSGWCTARQTMATPKPPPIRHRRHRCRYRHRQVYHTYRRVY